MRVEFGSFSTPTGFSISILIQNDSGRLMEALGGLAHTTKMILI